MSLSRAEANGYVVKYQGFASSMSRQASRRVDVVDFEELRSTALEAMVKHAPRFDPDRGLSFATFIRWPILAAFKERVMLEQRCAYVPECDIPDRDQEAPEDKADERIDAELALGRIEDDPEPRGMTADDAQEILLRRALDQSYAEIGRALGIHKTTVMRRERRALEMARATAGGPKPDIP